MGSRMGRDKIALTVDLYQHVSPSMQQAAADAMEEVNTSLFYLKPVNLFLIAQARTTRWSRHLVPAGPQKGTRRVQDGMARGKAPLQRRTSCLTATLRW